MRVPQVLRDPCTWARVHAGLTCLWLVLITPSVIWWSESVPWLVLMSCYANVAGSAASWQSARADRNSPSGDDLARVEAKIDDLVRGG
jgi:hypothetical protein